MDGSIGNALRGRVERGLEYVTYFVVQLIGLGGEGRGGEPAAIIVEKVRRYKVVLSCVEANF